MQKPFCFLGLEGRACSCIWVMTPKYTLIKQLIDGRIKVKHTEFCIKPGFAVAGPAAADAPQLKDFIL